jgi:hypothetical protein
MHVLGGMGAALLQPVMAPSGDRWAVQLQSLSHTCWTACRQQDLVLSVGWAVSFGLLVSVGVSTCTQYIWVRAACTSNMCIAGVFPECVPWF